MLHAHVEPYHSCSWAQHQRIFPSFLLCQRNWGYARCSGWCGPHLLIVVSSCTGSQQVRACRDCLGLVVYGVSKTDLLWLGDGRQIYPQQFWIYVRSTCCSVFGSTSDQLSKILDLLEQAINAWVQAMHERRHFVSWRNSGSWICSNLSRASLTPVPVGFVDRWLRIWFVFDEALD